MLRNTARRPVLTRVLLVLALLALGLRTAAPTGYMFTRTAESGVIEVTLCNGHGPQTMRLDLGDSGGPEKSGDKSAGKDAPCLFAAAAALAAPETPPALTTGPSFSRKGEPPLFAAVAVGRGLAAPPPWSTGPPATA